MRQSIFSSSQSDLQDDWLTEYPGSVVTLGGRLGVLTDVVKRVSCHCGADDQANGSARRGVRPLDSLTAQNGRQDDVLPAQVGELIAKSVVKSHLPSMMAIQATNTLTSAVTDSPTRLRDGIVRF
ncbi:unnamed protein product [Schistocephalus solidus]|uniref:Uncharacterized protein n=1 Tax=Schistocephalus solidus TaxID=70667 RepID=A0A183SP66_SCHSO|nr:unnamed protein product [Schistocephalus solidus]